MHRVIFPIIVPFLITLGSFIGFLTLKLLGIFATDFSFYLVFSIPICVYLSALIVWVLNPQQKDMVPTIVAGSAFVGFLIGAILLTNFVGLGFTPIPVLEIFFSQEGLNRTLPYFFKNFNSANSANIVQPIFLFLMTPIVTSIIGIFLGCLIYFEKPSLSRDRIRQATIRAVIPILLIVLFKILSPKSSAFLFPQTQAVTMILGAYFRINSWQH